ncbi:hypothetical protein AVEN_274962-1 [Araneus ventricosus]|uniref:Uncharacterized protein n=1 Tax=Araneus ventricosus TaxID=182803 RepID=A0A4Y2QPJ6_ARAVE|nr:hypothetical protein AVEN_274962-1 [Araneus ventricosus]
MPVLCFYHCTTKRRDSSKNSMLRVRQNYWNNGDAGKKVFNIMPSVCLRPTNWIGEDVIFFFEHGPFLPTSKGSTSLITTISAVVMGLARHFTMPRSAQSQSLGI